MDMKAGVPFWELLTLGGRECIGTYHENVVPHGQPINLTSKLPINQIPNPDLLVWRFVEYDISEAEVPVESLGYRVCIHHG